MNSKISNKLHIFILKILKIHNEKLVKYCLSKYQLRIHSSINELRIKNKFEINNNLSFLNPYSLKKVNVLQK